MPHLRAIERRTSRASADAAAFPFSVPAVRSLERLDLSAGVTFFVGENGSGKSTLLEGIAAAAGLPTVGSADVARDDTLAVQRRLRDAFQLVWTRRTRRGFFLRAEDFFGFARRMAALRAEMEARLGEVDAAYADRSAYARNLAAGPARASLAGLAQRYGEGLDAQSHGEGFLALFRARLVPDGLYLLDEPEAALSPQSQLGLMVMIHTMLGRRAQFVIATHAPILLAFPGARIYSFDADPVAEAAFDDLEHVRLTREFLAAPERFLARMLDAM